MPNRPAPMHDDSPGQERLSAPGDGFKGSDPGELNRRNGGRGKPQSRACSVRHGKGRPSGPTLSVRYKMLAVRPRGKVCQELGSSNARPTAGRRSARQENK